MSDFMERLDPNLLLLSKSFLSFRDICALRPVSKSWMDIRSTPFPHLVYFFGDGSNVDLPDSSDASFRQCLLAATLTKLHCEIFTRDDLSFVLQIIPQVKDLTFEIDVSDFREDCAFQWDPYILSPAMKVQRLELVTTGTSERWQFQVDFATHLELTHIETNGYMRYENYDGRPMKCLSVANAHWPHGAFEITPNLDLLKLGPKYTQHWPHHEEFAQRWICDPTLKPQNVEINRDGMTYFYVRKGNPSIVTAAPIFEIHGATTELFVSEYRRAVSIMLLFFRGNVELQFHGQCDERTKKIWLSFVNKERKVQSLPPLNVEEIATSSVYT